MGCCYSRVEREEMVSRCKARKRYMKQFVKARQALSSSHTMYLRSLRSTGSALLQFANAETTLHHHHHLTPPSPSPSSRPHTPLPPPPPPLSSSTDTWTTTTNSVTASPLPPPPPPPIHQQTWDFWDPFVASSSRSVTEEEWEMTKVVTASVAAPPSVVSGFSKESCSDFAVVVSRNSKDLVEIVKEIDDYFLMASDAGAQLSLLLEVPTPTFTYHISAGKVYNYGRNLSTLTWINGSKSKLNEFGKLDEEIDLTGEGIVRTSHCCTAERLYAWEKKLYLEVKNAEITKKEHEKKAGLLRKLEMKRSEYVKSEKIKKEVEKLESIMMVATQAIETTSIEIIKLRESELYPQLIDLVKGLMCMWRSMYECHQVQTQIVSQLKYLNTIPSTQPTSEIHRQSTLQLELEVQQWHISFCNIVNAQKNYIQSLTGWLRLSLFQFTKNPLSKTTQESKIYSLCEEWHLAIDRVPDKVASEGIKSFLTIIHAIVLQQTEEQKQKKRSEHAFKELEKKSAKLKSLENKYGPYSMVGASSTKTRAMIAEIRAKVEILQARAEEEKARYEKAISVTRAMTLNNLQMGFPHVFLAITGFSSVCVRAFESVYNQAKNTLDMHNIKMILPQERTASSISSRQS